MSGKIFGAILVVLGCGSFGATLSASVKREEQMLRQFLTALDYMQCELQYRLTPLPDLCKVAGEEQKGIIGQFFAFLSKELESQTAPDVISCVQKVLSVIGFLPGSVNGILELFGSSLGRFDLEGQIKGLEYVRSVCREEVNKLSQNRDLRLRCYQTLSLCAGAALAIIFV